MSQETKLRKFATLMSGLDPHPDVSAAELVDSIRKGAEDALRTSDATSEELTEKDLWQLADKYQTIPEVVKAILADAAILAQQAKGETK